MIGFFIEPSAVAAARLATAPPIPFNATARGSAARPQLDQTRKPNDNFWTRMLFETMSLEDEPMRIVTLVNAVVAWGNFAARSEREAKKVELLALVGRLIRIGRLRRVGSHHVTIPTSDEKYQAYLTRAAAPVELPEPCL